MNISNITDISIHIITEYYKNNLAPFFESIDQDILWIGPAERQWLQGRDTIIQAFSAEHHPLSFTMSNITVSSVPCGRQGCEVILTYLIYTHYPSGSHTVHDQRLHYTWRETKVVDEHGQKQTVPKIAVIHISNAFPYDDRDNIYPIHYEEIDVPGIPDPVTGARISISGLNRNQHYLLVNTIPYIRTNAEQGCTVIHTLSEDIPTTESLSSLEKRCNDHFLRVHASYLINPLFVRSIRRFAITLSDGTEIPVPNRKYAQVKKSLEAWLS